MNDAILSIEQVAEATPWSASTLYRVAKEPGSPFKKQAGRWVTTESKLHEWVEAGETPRKSSGYPMPKPRRQRGGELLANVRERRRSVA